MEPVGSAVSLRKSIHRLSSRETHMGASPDIGPWDVLGRLLYVTCYLRKAMF